VGKFLCYPKSRTPGHLGGIQGRVSRPLYSRRAYGHESGRRAYGHESVMEYVDKFNHLSQYATEHVNTNKMKKAYFMCGLIQSFKL